MQFWIKDAKLKLILILSLSVKGYFFVESHDSAPAPKKLFDDFPDLLATGDPTSEDPAVAGRGTVNFLTIFYVLLIAVKAVR